MKVNTLITAVLTLGMLVAASDSAVASAKERKLIRKHDCTKCHAISKKKDGPSFQEIAKKYRDDPEALQTLYTHVTTESTVEIDGKEETHKPIDIQDRQQIEELISWILSH